MSDSPNRPDVVDFYESEKQYKTRLKPCPACSFTQEQLVAAYEAGMEKCREEIAFWETRGRDICRKALWKTVITEAISTLAELGDSSFFEKYRSSCHAASQESYTRWRPVLMGYAAIMRTLGIEPPAVLPERIQHAINTHFEAREKGRRGV